MKLLHTILLVVLLRLKPLLTSCTLMPIMPFWVGYLSNKIKKKKPKSKWNAAKGQRQRQQQQQVTDWRRRRRLRVASHCYTHPHTQHHPPPSSRHPSPFGAVKGRGEGGVGPQRMQFGVCFPWNLCCIIAAICRSGDVRAIRVLRPQAYWLETHNLPPFAPPTLR